MSVTIAREVARHGGHAYFVGGFVRDMLMARAAADGGNGTDGGNAPGVGTGSNDVCVGSGVRGGGNASGAELCGVESKDIDIEVHGLAPETLEAILSGLGEVKTMGESFGVFSLRHYGIDIAMPRREHATGRGHKDFKVYVDPFIGTENAARRRDFTVNALMQDVLTGEVLDYFGGCEDLRRGILRHVNDESFVEDPLRAFRGAQFAARFGFSVAPETLAICARMDVSALSRERVFGETEKALLRSEAPGRYFRLLGEMAQLGCWFKEVERYYAEGGVNGPKALLMDKLLGAAAAVKHASEYPLGFMCAVLTAVLGASVSGRSWLSASAGDNADWLSAGAKDNAAWLRRLDNNRDLVRYSESTSGTAKRLLAFALYAAVNDVVLPSEAAANDAALPPETAVNDVVLPPETVAQLPLLLDEAVAPDDAVRLAGLILMKAASLTGMRLSYDRRRRLVTALRAGLKLYKQRIRRPGVTGADLIEHGFTPGPALGSALKLGRRLQLEGVGKAEALKAVLDAVAHNGEASG